MKQWDKSISQHLKIRVDAIETINEWTKNELILRDEPGAWV
jgi:hypothetical protein